VNKTMVSGAVALLLAAGAARAQGGAAAAQGGQGAAPGQMTPTQQQGQTGSGQDPSQQRPEGSPPAGAQRGADEPAGEGTSLSERVDLVEVQQKDAVVTGDVPGSFRIPGTDVSVRIYGFAELNWVHDFRGDNSDVDYSTFVPYVPLRGSEAAERRNRDYFTGRTSRIGVEAATPTRFGAIAMKIEGDFNNEPRTGTTAINETNTADGTDLDNTIFTQQATNSYGFRIRHAYGSFAGLLAGQTWSTFQDVDNAPETVDYNGPIGNTFIRQPLVRYTYAAGTRGKYTIALENAVTYVLDENIAVQNSSLSRMPDVVLRWDGSYGWGSMSVRGVTLEHHLDTGTNEVSARGYGLASTVFLKVRGRDYLSVGATYGDGIGRYLNYIEGALYDSADDEILLEQAIGVTAGYQFKPLDGLRINFVYGMTRNFDNEYTSFARNNALLASDRFGINRQVHQAHVGPIWTPVKGVDLGIEGIYGWRQTVGAQVGDMVRVNFSAKYYIN
jgi:hypothetical protein